MNLTNSNLRVSGNILFSFLLIFLVFSCEKDALRTSDKEFNDLQLTDISQLGNKNSKVDVCHVTGNGDSHVININRNAWSAHELHGDAIDNDGDGLFDRPNGCSDVDCNDEDPINLSGQYCGQISYTNEFGETLGSNYYFITIAEGTCDVIVDADYCAPGAITWELLETNGNVYTYLETDPCGIDGCFITIVNNGSSINISFNCDGIPDDAIIEGSLSAFEGEPIFDFWALPIDNDGDGWYQEIANYYYTACPPEGYISLDEIFSSQVYKFGDCDDENPDIYPGAVEICNGVDSNCDVFRNYPDGLVNGNFAGSASFGPSDATISGAEWSDVNPNTGCTGFFDPNPITTDLTGKIALIDRGLCNFDTKTKYAEEKGAIAVIICNITNDPILMGASGFVEEPSIPVLSLGFDQCNEIRLNPDGLIDFEVSCNPFIALARNDSPTNGEFMMFDKAENLSAAGTAPYSKFKSIKNLPKLDRIENQKVNKKQLKYESKNSKLSVIIAEQ